MLHSVYRTISRIPCLVGLHRWRDSHSMPEQVCKGCHKRRRTYV